MTIATIAPPSVEPLTLAQTKAHLRIDHSDEDDLILALIRAARLHLERQYGVMPIEQGLRLYLDAWPEAGAILIARFPVMRIDEIRLYDRDGNPQIVDPALAVLDNAERPARLWLQDRPSGLRSVNGVEIDFTAGFGSSGAEVPDDVSRALLMHVALMHALRTGIGLESQPAAVPDGYERLLAPYRFLRL